MKEKSGGKFIPPLFAYNDCSGAVYFSKRNPPPRRTM